MDSNQHHREMQTITALLNAVTSFKTATELWDLLAEIRGISDLLLSDTPVASAWVMAEEDTSLWEFTV